MLLKTSDTKTIKPFLSKIYIPPANSHKGQNGKLLIIGGSKKFHAASLWAAEIASHFIDIVHYSSVPENIEIVLSLKKVFRNGIVVHHEDLLAYAEEDDAILIGPGMERGENEEAKFTHAITYDLIKRFPDKRFVFDAGALQMMEANWLKFLTKEKPIVTPHQVEFTKLFGIPLLSKTMAEKTAIVQSTAKKYQCLILLKAVKDIISDGNQTVIVEGGNAGLSKGGSGDILAGLAGALYTRNDPLTAAVMASYAIKKTADQLATDYGYWYNMSTVINKLPETFSKLVYNSQV